MLMTANQHRIVIRRASPHDADIVAALTDAAYAAYISRLGRKAQLMAADYRHLATEHPVWLLYLGDQPAGVLMLMCEGVPTPYLARHVVSQPRAGRRARRAKEGRCASCSHPIPPLPVTPAVRSKMCRQIAAAKPHEDRCQ